MQDPCGRLPAPDSYAGSSGTKHRRLQRAPHPIFTLQGVARDKDDSYALSRDSSDIFLVSFLGF